MRPVDTGTSQAYTDEANKNYNFNADTQNAIQTLIGANLKVGSKLLQNLIQEPKRGVQQLEAPDAQAFVYQYNKDSLSPNPNERQTLWQAIFNSMVNTRYPKAQQYLIEQIGAFCSYCEVPVPQSIEVEHVAPKGPFPDVCTSWENFLLACSPCNKLKSNNPGPGTLASLPNGHTPQDGSDALSIIKDPNHYALAFCGAAVSDEIFPALVYQTPKGKLWNAIPTTIDIFNLQNTVSVDMKSQTAEAKLYDIAGGTNQYKNIQVENQAKSAATPSSLFARSPGDRVNDLAKLNRLGNKRIQYIPDPNDPNFKYIDRRVMRRTKAWFDILKYIDTLLKAQDQQAFEQAWNAQTSSLANIIGFWSVWKTILENIPDPYNQPYKLFERFKADQKVQKVFPNTLW